MHSLSQKKSSAVGLSEQCKCTFSLKLEDEIVLINNCQRW